MIADTFSPTRRALLARSSLAVAVSVGSFLAPGVSVASEPGSASLRLTDNVAVAQRFFELLRRKDIEAWADLWAGNGHIIVPYPPEGFGTSIDGKAAILSAFRGLFGNFETFDTELTGIYPAADSDAVVVEYNVRATLVGGTRYTNSNIAVFRFEDGLITAYHDYFDPRRFQVVIDALPKP
ncbi:nuclear transport factor 2 family protein [Sphingomonas sp. DT-207]|uniref:nuclear transport factor 2 family protein n=1 Tax=Sphingomonas sp. DT-207 TaxID=3396167 RepID=UPI003F1C6D0D